MKKKRPSRRERSDLGKGQRVRASFCRSGSSSRSLEDGAEAKRIAKNPNVDTSFLPDRDREAEDRLHREDLRKEWLAKQEELKQEIIEITYSYWDGSGHRKTVEVSESRAWHEESA